MKSKWWRIVLAVIAVSGLGILYTQSAVRKNLVTLNVRDMDVREVAGKLERQTWEKIYVHEDVSGKVTLNVRKIPLETVLEIVSEQTSSRWTALYPIYSSRKSLALFKEAVSGKARASENGWKALQSNRFGTGMFGDSSRNQNKLVTLNLQNKDVDVAAMAISRFSQAQVVPEDSIGGTVNLVVSDATIPEAVDQLATKAHRNWARLYALQPSRWGGNRGEGRREFGRQDDGTNSPSRDEQWRSERMEEARKQFEAQLAAMTPEERARAEEMRKQFENMRNLPPEQRRERMGDMASRPEFQNRMQGRMMGSIKNRSPEQRVERDQRYNERRKRSGR